MVRLSKKWHKMKWRKIQRKEQNVFVGPRFKRINKKLNREIQAWNSEKYSRITRKRSNISDSRLQHTISINYLGCIKPYRQVHTNQSPVMHTWPSYATERVILRQEKRKSVWEKETSRSRTGREGVSTSEFTRNRSEQG